MGRRGFVAAVLAFLAVPAFAQSRKRTWRTPWIRTPFNIKRDFPEYRRLGATDYMRVNRTYWQRQKPGFGHYPRPWGPCSRAAFYQARELYPVLPPNYKSPARSWWESYLRRREQR